jgi:threonine dehydratase
MSKVGVMIEPISINEIVEAKKRIADTITRTPLVKLEIDDSPAEIFLKLENLQPTGSFKIRGASNAIKSANPEDLKKGVWTISSGNHGQAVAWNARRHSLQCTIYAMSIASKTKINSMERLGAKIKYIKPSKNNDESRASLYPSSYPDQDGYCIHPFMNRDVLIGQGTIGLEILEDLPDVDAVLMPFGGGGLSCGVATAIKALKPDTKLYGCESETASPLTAAFNAGKPVDVPFTPSFLSGIGLPYILPEMWGLSKELLDGGLITGLNEIYDTVRKLAVHSKIVAEGASAVTVASALAGRAGSGKIVCIVSGGNINQEVFLNILQGEKP